MEGSAAERPARDRRRIWAVVAGVVIAGVVALLVVGLVNRDVGTSIQDALDAGKRPAAPDFQLPVLVAGDGIGPVGSQVSLADLRGRTVILNVWASWCTPCQAEAGVLERVQQIYAHRPRVVVLGVDVQDLTEDALGFVRAQGVTYPSLRDPSGNIERDYQVLGVPETFVIDPQGRIALHVIGQVQDPQQITHAVEQVS